MITFRPKAEKLVETPVGARRKEHQKIDGLCSRCGHQPDVHDRLAKPEEKGALGDKFRVVNVFSSKSTTGLGQPVAHLKIDLRHPVRTG